MWHVNDVMEQDRQMTVIATISSKIFIQLERKMFHQYFLNNCCLPLLRNYWKWMIHGN